MNDWDDAADKLYWLGVDGPTTSDYGRMIWRRERERLNPSEPEPSIADLQSGSTPSESHETWRSAHDTKHESLAPVERTAVRGLEDVQRDTVEDRRCGCGCGEELTGRADQKFVSRRHKQRHKQRLRRER